MSILAVGYYLEHCRLQGSEKLAMIALANYADDQRAECFPGIARIAHQLNIQIRPTQKLFAKLVEKGELQILKNQGISTGTGRTNLYVLTAYLRHLKGEPLPVVADENTPDPDDFEGVICETQASSDDGVSPLEEVIPDAKGVIQGNEGMIGGSSDPSVLDPSVLDPSGGDHTIQDHPGASEAETPPPTAALPKNFAVIPSPGKSEEPKPIRGGSGFTGEKLLPSQQGPEALMQIATDKFRNGGNYQVNGGHHSIDGLTEQVKELGMDVVTYREMVDAFLQKYGMLELSVLKTDHACRTHTKAKQAVLSLCGIDPRFRTVAGMETVFQSWTANDWRGDSLPNADQLIEHAGKMKAGAVKCERKDKPTPTAAAPDFRGCTITDLPEPPLTPDREAAKRDKALEEERTQLHDRLHCAIKLYAKPTTSTHHDLIARWRAWNAEHPDKPVSLPKEWAAHVLA